VLTPALCCHKTRMLNVCIQNVVHDVISVCFSSVSAYLHIYCLNSKCCSCDFGLLYDCQCSPAYLVSVFKVLIRLDFLQLLLE
jgi:hypothetical protein